MILTRAILLKAIDFRVSDNFDYFFSDDYIDKSTDSLQAHFRFLHDLMLTVAADDPAALGYIFNGYLPIDESVYFQRC